MNSNSEQKAALSRIFYKPKDEIILGGIMLQVDRIGQKQIDFDTEYVDLF